MAAAPSSRAEPEQSKSEEVAPRVVAVDPGRSKCGVAAVGASGTVLYRNIVPTDQVTRIVVGLCGGRNVSVVVGNGTGSRPILETLRSAGLSVEEMDERHTSEEARRLYLRDHPPPGWRRWIPVGLRYPDEPYDDYVALILAERRISELNRLTNRR